MHLEVEFYVTNQAFAPSFVEGNQSFKADVGKVIDLSEGEKQVAYQNGYTNGHDAGFLEGQAKGYVEGYGKVQAVEDGLVTRNISGSYVNDRVTEVGNDAFRYCSKITEVHFANVKFIGYRAFANCSRLVTAALPLLNNADDQPFNTCPRLTTVLLPSLKTIPYRCFYGCSSLAEVEFPSVTYMGTYAFQGCSKLAKLVLSANSVCSLSSTNAFTGTLIASGTGFVYVPDNLVDSYKSAANWSTYADQIKPISELEGET